VQQLQAHLDSLDARGSVPPAHAAGLRTPPGVLWCGRQQASQPVAQAGLQDDQDEEDKACFPGQWVLVQNLPRFYLKHHFFRDALAGLGFECMNISAKENKARGRVTVKCRITDGSGQQVGASAARLIEEVKRSGLPAASALAKVIFAEHQEFPCLVKR